MTKEHLKTIDPAVLDAALNKTLGGFPPGSGTEKTNDKKAVVIAQAAFHSFFHS